jgi:hypothetical protein
MLPRVFIENSLLMLNSKYWQEVKIKKMEVSLKYVWSACIPLSQCFESFESSFSFYNRKPKYLKKLTIFQIQ